MKGYKTCLGGTLCLALAGGANAEDEMCNEGPSPEARANLRWTSGTGGELAAEVTRDLTWSIHVEARLGALRTTWTQGPLTSDANGTVTVTLSPPPSAFLDPLAEDYVTSLDVRLVATDARGARRAEMAAPPAFLGWPNGAAASPVVWDLATMQAQAPKGVVDATLRASLGDLEGVDHVLPPIFFTTPPPADDDVVEGG